MISFKKLQHLLIDRNISKMEFMNMSNLQPRTAAKLWKDEIVTTETVDRICTALDCNVEEIMEYIDPKKQKKGTNID